MIRSVPLARAALGNFILSLGGMCVFNSMLEAYLSAHRTMITGSALCTALAVTERD